MRTFGFIALGLATGVVVAVLAARLREKWEQDDLELMADGISDRLDALEQSLAPA